MDIQYDCCGGIDVHKRLIVVCLLCGSKRTVEPFGTDSQDIRRMRDWLVEHGCQAVAMESTGSYWKPLYNILELAGIEILVVNAQHMKNVPGRKTDVKDAEWIADLLQHGLLRGSYIPDREQRELRDLSRYRKGLIQERAREINRLQKMLEGGNIKLGNYVSDVTGQSSQKLLWRILRSSEPVTENEISEMIRPNMRHKVKDLMKALDGFLTDIQKELIMQILNHIDDMTRRIGKMDKLINEHMEKYQDAIERLSKMPGIGKRSAETILIETGLDMSRFPTAAHLASWAGLCPGNNESAGKRLSGRTNKGNVTLKTTLVQCAKTARKKAGSFFKAQYERLSVRRGKNRATVAVAHSMIIAIHHILKDNISFKDLGADYYTRIDPKKKLRYHQKKIEELKKAMGEATLSIEPA